MNAKPADREIVTFDYGIPAELFMGKRKGGARLGDQRFDGDDIQRLYESNDYPLQRRPSD